MRVAIQGTHGSFSEAAARRRWPDLETLPCREAKDVVAAVREGRGGGRVPADRELPDRLGHHDLRPARGGVRRRHAPAHARDPLPRAPHADGGAGRHARRHQAGALPPGRAGPVPRSGCRTHLPDVELVSAWDTAGSAEIVAQEGNPAHRRDRRASRRRRPRAGAAGRADRGRSHQPDPVPHLHPLRGAGAPGRQQPG